MHRTPLVRNFHSLYTAIKLKRFTEHSGSCGHKFCQICNKTKELLSFSPYIVNLAMFDVERIPLAVATHTYSPVSVTCVLAI